MNRYIVRLTIEKPDGGVVKTKILYFLNCEPNEAVVGFNWLINDTPWPDVEEIYQAIAEA